MGTPKNLLIIDGYNVIGRDPVLREKKARSLEAARAALAQIAAHWRSGRGGHDLLIVFDGRDPVGGHSSKMMIGGVRCLFTRTKVEADDEIIRAVRENRGSSSIIVVSDDNYVSNNCRAHGASVEPASFFEDARKKRSARQGRRTGAAEKSIDAKTVSDINEEQRRRFGL